MYLKKSLIALAATASLCAVASVALADHFDDGQWNATEKALKGKTVAFVPISMGFDLPQAWAAALQHDADKWGFKLVIRDPNWDVAAGAQALTQLIAEKPDLLIFHPLDMTAYAKLVKKAGDAGITTVQMNLKSLNTGDAYVGADWHDLLTQQTQAAVRFCGAGTSGKIALLQGNPTTPTVIIGMGGVNEVLGKNPGLKVVATQSADWDATKAHDITGTLLKQNEDLCAIVGFWDGQDIGARLQETAGGGDVEFLVVEHVGVRAGNRRCRIPGGEHGCVGVGHLLAVQIGDKPVVVFHAQREKLDRGRIRHCEGDAQVGRGVQIAHRLDAAARVMYGFAQCESILR